MKSKPTTDWRLTESGPLLKTFVAKKIKDLPDRQIEFTISTGSPDRHGDTVDVNGWSTDAYMKNPVVLYGHSYSDLPIGKCTSLYKSGGALVATAQFATADLNPMGDTVYKMLKAGFLNATSVGFLPLAHTMNDNRGYDFTKQELLEFSVVPVPANSEALARTLSFNLPRASSHKRISNEDALAIVQAAEQYLNKRYGSPLVPAATLKYILAKIILSEDF
jgi:HK97 family phage prohead protease